MAALVSFICNLFGAIVSFKRSLVNGWSEWLQCGYWADHLFCFQEMVCLSNEVPVQATIRDTIGMGLKKQSTIFLSPSKPVNSIFTEVASEFNYQVDAIQLTVQTRENTVSPFSPYILQFGLA